MCKRGFVWKLIVALLSVMLISVYSLSNSASLFAGDDAQSSITVNWGGKIDSQSTFSVTADWCVVKQASGTVILWTEEAVSDDIIAQIKTVTMQNDRSIDSGDSWVLINGFGSFTPVDASNFGTYSFTDAGSGSVTVQVYDKNSTTLNAGKISHLDYGTLTKVTPKGKIILTKKVENGSDVNGTFYFKLTNSSGEQVGVLKSVNVINGVVSGTVIWEDIEYGEYTIIETDKNGTALKTGDKTFGKELVSITGDNGTKVSLGAVAAAPPATLGNITWKNGTWSNLFGSASNINLLSFGNVSNVVDVEGNVAVAGDFTNSSGGFTAGAGVGGKGRTYSSDIAMMAGGNININGYFQTRGHVVTGSGTFKTANGADYNVAKESYTAAGLKSLYNATEVSDKSTYFEVRGNAANTNLRASDNGQLDTFFKNAKTYMTSLHEKLAAMTPNGKVTDNGDIITLKGTDKSVNIFEVNMSGKANRTLTIDCPSTSAVIINVKGSTITSGYGAWGTVAMQKNTIFNFVDCTKLTMGGPTVFYGSVVAPEMELDVNGKNGSINGNAVIGNLVNKQSGFECHEYYFNQKLADEVNAEITNTFADNPVSVQLGVEKVIEGRSFQSGDSFTFDLVKGTDTSAEPVDQVTAKATSGNSQTVNFSPIEFKEAGTYVYTIREHVPADKDKIAGITYSGESYKVTVTVVKNKNGKLEASYTMEDSAGKTASKASFTNKYDAGGSVQLKAGKTLSGATLTAGQFSFAVYKQGGTEAVATASNEADGSIVFTPLSYKLSDLEGSQSRTFAYEIREVVGVTGLISGMHYDNTLYRAVVTVSDNGSGVLNAKAVYYDANGDAIDGTPVFHNSMEQYTSRTVTKTWDDSDDLYKERPAEVTVHLLKNGTVVDTQKLNAANGWTYKWDRLAKYDNGQLIKYTVTEDAVKDYSTTISGGTDAAGDNGQFSITNTYDGYKAIYVSRTVKKVWSDNSNSTGSRPARIMVQLYADGVAKGDPVEVNAAGNWEYTWNELPGADNGREIAYTVKELSVISGYTASYSDDTFTITNTKGGGGGGDTPGTYGASASNNESSGPKTGDTSDLTLELIILALAALGLGGVVYIRRRAQSKR